MAEPVKKSSTTRKASTAKTPSKTATAKAAPTPIAEVATGAPKKTVKAKVTAIGVSHEQVALLAHRFWAERGRQHGHHEDDWFRAEQELIGKAFIGKAS